MNETRLIGCSPEPIAGYLKALAVLRLVAEDSEGGDPDARASWSGDALVFSSRFDREGLVEFFFNRYRPTPILTPWNAGGGFYGGGAEPLEAVARSSSPRLASYRETISVVRSLIPAQAPKDEDKGELLIRCRSELADAIVPWLDACFVLGEDKASFFPLLGTGGNDGRLDFTNNFMQRLADIIPFQEQDQVADSRGWLASALFGEGMTPLGRSAVGQFQPGNLGGPNGVQGSFEADSRVNPWDFVLTIEGALLFAGSVARRLGADSRGRAAFPFAVQSVAVGYGSAVAAEETSEGSRAELWLPLWDRPASLPEVAHLFGEGRAQFGRRQARNSVEFALAVNLLGQDRGIVAFQRYGFLKRNGLAFLATPLGRVPVSPRPAEARHLDDPRLMAWLEQLRSACRDKGKTPARYQASLKAIDRALFHFAVRAQSDAPSDRKELLNVLAAVGRAERTLSRGSKFTAENAIRPLQGVDRRWLGVGRESREFRLAAALASIAPSRDGTIGPFRSHLEPIASKGRLVDWSSAGHSAVWTDRPLVENLAAVFLRRLMESGRATQDDGPRPKTRVGLHLDAQVFAHLGDVVAFLRGEIDDTLLNDLTWGLIGLDWQVPRRRTVKPSRPSQAVKPSRPIVPAAFAITRLVAHRVGLVDEPQTTSIGDDPNKGRRWRAVVDGRSKDSEPSAAGLMHIKPSARVFHLLRAGDARAAISLAEHRLRADGFAPFGTRNHGRHRASSGTEPTVDPARLLAACLFPLAPNALTLLARQALLPPSPDFL